MSAFAALTVIPAQLIWKGVVGRVLHGDKLTLAVVELAPDSVIPEHRHENEQVGICVAGSLLFRVAGERRELGPGETWRIAPFTPHEVATGRDGAIVIETFAPPRGDWEELERVPGEPRWPR
jgi:quercetin dioxygenase-like cupin family protein